MLLGIFINKKILIKLLTFTLGKGVYLICQEGCAMEYTVQKLSELAKISSRMLR